MLQTVPIWPSPDATENKHLPDMLSIASAGHEHHTDWFQRHRDTGIKTVGLIVAAESAVIGFFSTQGHQAALVIPVRVLLLYLALLAPVAGYSAIASCKRSFAASLESAMLVAKIIWALGLASKVKVHSGHVDMSKCPGADDEYMYVPRWMDDKLLGKIDNKNTTENYVETILRKKYTTLYWAKLTIAVFAMSAFLVGIVASFTVVQ